MVVSRQEQLLVQTSLLQINLFSPLNGRIFSTNKYKRFHNPSSGYGHPSSSETSLLTACKSHCLSSYVIKEVLAVLLIDWVVKNFIFHLVSEFDLHGTLKIVEFPSTIPPASSN